MFIQKIHVLLCALGFSLKLELPLSIPLSALLEGANLLPDFNVNIRENYNIYNIIIDNGLFYR